MALQFTNLVVAMDGRQRAQTETQNMTGGTKRLVSFAATTGTGEGLLQVDFPIRFQERPAFSFGWEVLNNWPLITNSYPTLSAGVFRWKVEYAQTTGQRTWLGATLVVVVTGPISQETTLTLEVHSLFEGRTLQGGV